MISSNVKHVSTAAMEIVCAIVNITGLNLFELESVGELAVSALEDEEQHLRLEALRLLGRVGVFPAAVQPLIMSLQDCGMEIRVEVCRSLALVTSSGNEEVVAAFVTLATQACDAETTVAALTG